MLLTWSSSTTLNYSSLHREDFYNGKSHGIEAIQPDDCTVIKNALSVREYILINSNDGFESPSSQKLMV